MAEDYLTDDEQLEEVKRTLIEYGPWILGGLIIGLGGLIGWNYYRSHREAAALQAAGQFNQMSAALQTDDRKKTRDLADGLIKNFPDSPYADQARLTIARLAVDEGQDAGAVAELTSVMNDSKDSDLRQIARIRLARVLIDEGKPDDAIKVLTDGTPGTFAGRYHEVHGDALLAKKDPAGAVVEFKAAQAAADAAGVDGSLLELKLADLGSKGTP